MPNNAFFSMTIHSYDIFLFQTINRYVASVCSVLFYCFCSLVLQLFPDLTVEEHLQLFASFKVRIGFRFVAAYFQQSYTLTYLFYAVRSFLRLFCIFCRAHQKPSSRMKSSDVTGAVDGAVMSASPSAWH